MDEYLKEKLERAEIQAEEKQRLISTLDPWDIGDNSIYE